MPFGILIHDMAGRTPDNILPGDIQAIDRIAGLVDQVSQARMLENS